jgi:hypothetical protein
MTTNLTITEQLYQLFVKGKYAGQTSTVDGVLANKKLQDYFGILHHDFESKDQFIKQMSRLGLHVVHANPLRAAGTGNRYQIVIPSFLANSSLFKETLHALVVENDIIKFSYKFGLINSQLFPSIGFKDEEDRMSWRILDWSAHPNALVATKGMIDRELYTEAVIYYVFLNMLAKIKNGVASSILPKAATIAEKNALKLQPVFDWAAHHHAFRTLYVKPVPTTNKVLNFYRKNDVETPGTATLKNFSAPDRKMVVENAACALGNCKVKEGKASGLLVSGALKLDKPFDTSSFDCNDAYERETLDEFGRQLQLVLDKNESDTELCKRVKTALVKKYPKH